MKLTLMALAVSISLTAQPFEALSPLQIFASFGAVAQVKATEPLPPVPTEWDGVVVEFTPLALSSSKPSTGPGREAGTWSVFVCNLSANQVILPRAMILRSSPVLRWIPDGHREQLLASRNRRSGWRVLGNVFKDYGTIGAAAAGIAFSGLTAGAGAAFGATEIKHFIESSQKRVDENIVEYKLYAPLPEKVVLEPKACGEFDALSSLLPRDQAVRHSARIGR